MSLIDNIFPNFKKTVFDSLTKNKSEIYDLTSRQLFDLENLNFFRKEQEDFEKKINSLNDSDRSQLKKEAIEILSEKMKSSQFGFYYGDFGKSYHRMQTNLQLVKEALKEKKEPKICELGSNAGGWTALWFDYNGIINPKNYTACDIVPDFCRSIATLGFNCVPINFAKENIQDLLQNDYDLVVITEVIEHMPNEKSGFDLIDSGMSILKEKGSILVSYPRDVGEISSDPLGHQYQPNKARINDRFSKYFNDVMMSYDGSREFHLFIEKK